MCLKIWTENKRLYVIKFMKFDHNIIYYCKENLNFLIDMENLSILQRYIKCLYWATITATSTGY